MVPVARRNLFAESGRFAVSVLGVAVAVLLILTVLGLYRGWSRSGETFEQLPGQLWVVQAGTSDPFHSASSVEQSSLAHVASVDGVSAVVPVLSRQMSFGSDGESTVRLMALGVPAGVAMDEETRMRFLPEPGNMIIDRTLSRKTGLDEGDVAQFGDVNLKVSRVGPRSSEVLTPFAFVHYSDAERIFGIGGIATFGMLVLNEDATPGEVKAAIEAEHPELEVLTAREFARAVRKEIDEAFIPVIVILVGIGFLVGGAVVGLTIYTATIERSREFGVMKAVGASPSFLYRIVMSQSALLTLLGFGAGLAGAYVVSNVAERLVPEFITEFQLRDLALVFAVALVMSGVASLVPARRISSIDPASVFRA